MAKLTKRLGTAEGDSALSGCSHTDRYSLIPRDNNWTDALLPTARQTRFQLSFPVRGLCSWIIWLLLRTGKSELSKTDRRFKPVTAVMKWFPVGLQVEMRGSSNCIASVHFPESESFLSAPVPWTHCGRLRRNLRSSF